MKKKMNFAQISRTVFWLGLIICVGLATARAQANGTVIPTVCFEPKPETFTRTLTADLSGGTGTINSPVPLGYNSLILNPGGATEERFSIVLINANGNGFLINYSGNPNPSIIHPHPAGETVLLATDGKAVYGYNNTDNNAATIPRGISGGNYFFPGSLVYAPAFGHPTIFQPGIHSNVFLLNLVSGINITWFLNGGQATSNQSGAQDCGTITYQGRLSNAGSAANGQFDLQFQAFDAEAGGTSQSELIVVEDIQVTNGIFTVPLKFGSTLSNNFKVRFLEIGVRAGTSTNAFTILTPRQPLTQVPYAVNAQTAQTAFDVVLKLTDNMPSSTECDETSERGRMKVDAANNRLYICTVTGWKFTSLQ